MFSTADFFVVGLALDISGAYLLARGLLLPPNEIGTITGTYVGYNSGATIARAEDRVDAEFGVAALLIGFALQAVGYVSQLLGAETSTGVEEGVVAFLLGVLAAGAVLATWRRVRPRRVLRLLVRVALTSGDPEHPGPDWTQRKAARLMDYGKAAGYPVTAEEEASGKVAYVRRVFGFELPPMVN